jgi:hypothetical protein
MEIRHDLLSRNLTDTEVRSSFDWILACLSRHGVTTVSVTFGYDWGDWQHETVELAGVRSRVEDAEARQLGSLGTDDLYIEVEGVVQIQYCHHADIHLTYIQPDHPLARALATYLTEAIGLHEQ